MSLDKMQLPKVNKIKLKSKQNQTKLKSIIMEAVEKFEKENKYNFEPFEVDNVLLSIIKENHESYLISKYGYDIIS